MRTFSFYANFNGSRRASLAGIEDSPENWASNSCYSSSHLFSSLLITILLALSPVIILASGLL